MAGVFHDLRVLDLTWGSAGPMATMLLADHGADVIRIEKPGGAPFDEPESYRVWNRGKRSAELDLSSDADRETFLSLVERSDVVIESYAPGTADKLGIGYETLSARNPAIVHCSITAYGKGTRDADRPGFDPLVAARMGQQWEWRGFYGSPMDHIQGDDRAEADFEVPEPSRTGSDRDGPLFIASPQPSVGAAHLASIGIAAALHVRAATGKGQHVETSLAQGLLFYNSCTWQRPEHLHSPGYQMDMMDRRQNWGLMEVKDGWVCMWGGPPLWPMMAAEGDELSPPDPAEFRAKMMAGGMAGMASLRARVESLAEASPSLKKFGRAEWDEAATSVQFNLQPVRSVEEALVDTDSIGDGSVVTIDDPDRGPINMAGVLFRLKDAPAEPQGPAPRRGQHTDEVKALAGAPAGPRPVTDGNAEVPEGGPLAGIRVLDFGFAVAGPFTSQILADMGAEVIKIDTAARGGWGGNHMGMGVNKNKRHVAMDAKNPAAQDVLWALIESADVITHNMKPGADTRLGIDYESVKARNPGIVYLHTRAHQVGPRSDRGGHDQSANSLGGTVFEDGGGHDGGRPYFSVGSGGDLGNGFLGASAVLYGLFHRDRTGVGTAVDTSILNSSLFNGSRLYTNPEGDVLDLPRIDREQRGFSATQRVYECADGEWICLFVAGDAHWQGLTTVVSGLTENGRFADAAARRSNDTDLGKLLDATFAERPAAEWVKLLDAAGVPAEISDHTFAQKVFDDQEFIDRGWVVKLDHPVVGAIDMWGIGIEFSETPSRADGPAALSGQHTTEVLTEMGFGDKLDELRAAGAIHCAEHAEDGAAAGQR